MTRSLLSLISKHTPRQASSTTEQKGSMDSGWSWLNRNTKNKEAESSDDDKNHKHRKKSWSEVVVGLPGQGGAGDVKASHTAPPVTTAVTSKTLDLKKTYTGKQVFAILAK